MRSSKPPGKQRSAATEEKENGHAAALGRAPQKRPEKIRQTPRCYQLLGVLIFASVLAHPALAQELAPLENIADFIVNFLTGAFARSVAIIAVAVLGFLGLTGRLRWGIAGSVIGGIALIFGAATIVDAVSGAV